MTSKTAFEISGDVVTSPMGDELALLDFNSSTYFTLNATGTAVWEALKEPNTVEDISQAIASRYGISPDTSRADVEDLIEQLLAAGLVKTKG